MSNPFVEPILDNGQGVIDPDVYFQINKPPTDLPEFESKLSAFVDYHKEKGNNVVFITSGGTTVPLENQTVRFIDNFSNGTRGASSAEYFLKAGYAVVFMHRQNSIQPFHRHFGHMLDYVEPKQDGTVQVRPEYVDAIHTVLTKYHQVKEKNLMLMLDFVTLPEYLFKLQAGTKILARLQNKAMYYLAAAVSDFFIRSEKMAEHKIQSRDGGLTLTLDQVPKFLKPLVSHWASKGLIVSFKLETDNTLLVPKARQALNRYGHQVVIGNMLKTRKQTVTLITQHSERVLSLTQEELDNEVEIESRIISELVAIHQHWMASGHTEQ
ncbi:DNA/pantothenate metabolism flavoprotein [Gilbertella persicaria]|uniref:DNA/pantothenate metabolism flavoprotein n=1 Tax=Gilbertella persicaria TaxID=101096 RepID=UPI00221EBD68|nr:DNA/pantothenate metabolism flavoprotein [Gilbertella persicaria]KAI8080772.1 DNA/pantothenate metabolism flavoprotein [Gilbertella persicaria]